MALQPLTPFTACYAYSIDTDKNITGYSTNGGSKRATIWKYPSYAPETFSGVISSEAFQSNYHFGATETLGYVTQAGLTVPRVWTSATEYWVLDSPPASNTLALSGNTYYSTGYKQFAGYQTGGFGNRGVLWNNRFGLVFNELVHSSSGTGWNVTKCNDINDNGLVAGSGLRNASQHGFWAEPMKNLGQTSIAVSSSVILEDFLGDGMLKPVTFQLKQGSTLVEPVPNVTPSAPNTYTFSTLQRGTFDVYAKAPNHLRKKVTGVVFSDSGASGMTFSLKNGDADGDNDIDARDLKAVKDALLSQSLLGDMNGDGVVNAGDLAIVKRNYGRVGD